MTIDGFTQGEGGVPFRYPNQTTSQSLSITGDPTGGYFNLTTSAPLPVGTAKINFDASSSDVQTALEAIVGVGNVKVYGSNPLPAARSPSRSSASMPTRRSRLSCQIVAYT